MAALLDFGQLHCFQQQPVIELLQEACAQLLSVALLDELPLYRGGAAAA